MYKALLSLVVGFVVLILVEWLHKEGKLRTEVARKIIHVMSGIIIAIWPFFVSWTAIIIVEVGFLIAVAIARWFKLFGSQHGINRITWGEFFFPLGIIMTVLLHPARWVFVLAMLHLALADTAAALIGTKFGKSNSYKIFSQKKSVVGTLAFFFVSLLLVVVAIIIAPGNIDSLARTPLVMVPIISTLAENIGIYGLDNFFIPLTVVLLLG